MEGVLVVRKDFCDTAYNTPVSLCYLLCWLSDLVECAGRLCLRMTIRMLLILSRVPQERFVLLPCFINIFGFFVHMSTCWIDLFRTSIVSDRWKIWKTYRDWHFVVPRKNWSERYISFIMFILSHYASHFGNYVVLLPGRDEIELIVQCLHVSGGEDIIGTAHNFYKVCIFVKKKHCPLKNSMVWCNADIFSYLSVASSWQGLY